MRQCDARQYNQCDNMMYNYKGLELQWREWGRNKKSPVVRKQSQAIALFILPAVAVNPFSPHLVLSMGWLPCCISLSPLELIGRSFSCSQCSLRITIHKVYI